MTNQNKFLKRGQTMFDDYKKYEVLKQLLISQNITPSENEKKIQKLCKKIGI